MQLKLALLLVSKLNLGLSERLKNPKLLTIGPSNQKETDYFAQKSSVQ